MKRLIDFFLRPLRRNEPIYLAPDGKTAWDKIDASISTYLGDIDYPDKQPCFLEMTDGHPIGRFLSSWIRGYPNGDNMWVYFPPHGWVEANQLGEVNWSTVKGWCFGRWIKEKH